MHTGDVVKR